MICKLRLFCCDFEAAQSCHQSEIPAKKTNLLKTLHQVSVFQLDTRFIDMYNVSTQPTYITSH